MPTNTPLTGPALAAALFAAGLAPAGVQKAQQWTHGVPMFVHVHGAGYGIWEPWHRIGDVWHLVLCYRLRIELDYCRQGTWVWHEYEYERASDDANIPAAISRLSLRLRQIEVAQETR